MHGAAPPTENEPFYLGAHQYREKCNLRRVGGKMKLLQVPPAPAVRGTDEVNHDMTLCGGRFCQRSLGLLADVAGIRK